MTGPAQSLMVVDDDETFRTRLARAFEDRGFEVRTAKDGAEALRQAKEESPELVVVDLRMPEMNGLELVRALKTEDPTTNIVVLTGYGSIASAVDAVQLGATHYLTKPASAEDVLRAFHRSGPEDQLDERPSEVPSLARVEWEHIHRVLADTGGNISKAARLLGIHRRSLQRKLAKYPVSR